MFCPKCGKQVADGGKFCGGCGSSIAIANPSVVANQVEGDSPLWEAISFTESPSREQTTINMHQKFGWSLKSSQEINTSSTYVQGQSYNGTGQVNSYIVKEHYVKLTFERNKRMKNYNILKNMYDEFSLLAQEIQKLEASVYSRSGLFYLACCVPSVIMFIIFISSVPDIFGGLFWFPVLLGCAALYIPFTLIAAKVTESSARSKVAPLINSKYNQMGAIAEEAEKYL